MYFSGKGKRDSKLMKNVRNAGFLQKRGGNAASGPPPFQTLGSHTFVLIGNLHSCLIIITIDRSWSCLPPSINTDMCIARIFQRGGGSHCVKVRVLVCLDIFKLRRHGIFATCSGLFGLKRLAKGVSRTPQDPTWLRPWLIVSLKSPSTGPLEACSVNNKTCVEEAVITN